MNRRRLLGLVAAVGVTPFLGVPPAPARAAAPRDFRFRAMHRGATVGEHRAAFRQDGDRLTVSTRVDITVKVLFFTAFRFKHDAEEVWQAGRLVSVKSTTDDNGTPLQVSGYAAVDGFHILGEDGPFLAAAHLLTSDTLWDSRLVRESRLIDVQHGGEVGIVAKRLGDESVVHRSTPEQRGTIASVDGLRPGKKPGSDTAQAVLRLTRQKHARAVPTGVPLLDGAQEIENFNVGRPDYSAIGDLLHPTRLCFTRCPRSRDRASCRRRRTGWRR